MHSSNNIFIAITFIYFIGIPCSYACYNLINKDGEVVYSDVEPPFDTSFPPKGKDWIEAEAHGLRLNFIGTCKKTIQQQTKENIEYRNRQLAEQKRKMEEDKGISIIDERIHKAEEKRKKDEELRKNEAELETKRFEAAKQLELRKREFQKEQEQNKAAEIELEHRRSVEESWKPENIKRTVDGACNSGIIKSGELCDALRNIQPPR